jgi:predicted metalloprotease with PDZ domain
MKRFYAIMIIALPLLSFGSQETIGYLGVSTQRLSEAMSVALGIDHGTLVERVHDDSPAEEAGIAVGDIIMEIEGLKITDHGSLKQAVEEKPGATVKLTLFRKGKMMSQTVVLGEREKSKVRLDVDIPDLPDLKVILGTKALREDIDRLKQEIERLRDEIEQLKKELK